MPATDQATATAAPAPKKGRSTTLAKHKAKIEDRIIHTNAQLVDTQDVCNMLRLSEDALADVRRDAQANFPLPIQGISRKKTHWRLCDIEAYVESKRVESQKSAR